MAGQWQKQGSLQLMHPSPPLHHLPSWLDEASQGSTLGEWGVHKLKTGASFPVHICKLEIVAFLILEIQVFSVGT